MLLELKVLSFRSLSWHPRQVLAEEQVRWKEDGFLIPTSVFAFVLSRLPLLIRSISFQMAPFKEELQILIKTSVPCGLKAPEPLYLPRFLLGEPTLSI